jgi:hypothetical protein
MPNLTRRPTEKTNRRWTQIYADIEIGAQGTPKFNHGWTRMIGTYFASILDFYLRKSAFICG